MCEVKLKTCENKEKNTFVGWAESFSFSAQRCHTRQAWNSCRDKVQMRQTSCSDITKTSVSWYQRKMQEHPTSVIFIKSKKISVLYQMEQIHVTSKSNKSHSSEMSQSERNRLSSPSSSSYTANRTFQASTWNIFSALYGNGCCISHSDESGARPSLWQHRSLPLPLVQ